MPSDRRFVFPATHRLKKRADFQRLYTRGARVNGRYIVLFMMRAREEAGRFGVTASRRIGNAVVRSRCKRRLRELYRLHRHLPGVAGSDIVANARRSCIKASWADLEKDFRRCLERGVTGVGSAVIGDQDAAPV